MDADRASFSALKLVSLVGYSLNLCKAGCLVFVHSIGLGASRSAIMSISDVVCSCCGAVIPTR